VFTRTDEAFSHRGKAPRLQTTVMRVLASTSAEPLGAATHLDRAGDGESGRYLPVIDATDREAHLE
jgi:hypothetical protein